MKPAYFPNKLILGILAIFLSSLYTAKAQNLLISGSNSHSVVICSNGNVFAWGKNDVGQLGLDPNTNAPYGVASSTTPLRVGGLGEIFQIDAGSGSHTLALTCEGKVYAWGANTTGQLGNNTDAPGAFSAKPVLVKGGVTGTADLMGVHYVSGGNDESFAILNNGRAVAWGQNDKGQLGDGTTINRPAPVYILNGQTGQPLEDVVQIEAGDENGYALTADGRVWSWGEPTDSKALGRANTAQNSRAYPVQIQGGQDLTGIVAISAGDRHCLAISETGEVYSWGGDWGKGQLGRGPGYQDVNYAAKVVGGASGETFLGESDPVVSIAAGQAHSIASTASGKVYTWGSNGFFNCGTNCTTPAGQLGTGTLLTEPDYFGSDNGPNASPMLAKIGSAAGAGFTNAVSVSDGDAWSFVLTSDNKIYAAGWNREGQLSVAGNANQTSFRDITLPNCGVVSPCPTLDLGPDLKFCKTFSHILSAGLVYPQFEAILYKNDVKVTSTTVTGAAKEVTFTVTEYANEWKIEIVDKRGPTDRPCQPCPTARDSIKIEEYAPSFTVPQPQTFCTDFSAYVNGTGVYYWYKNQTGGTALDTTFKTQKTDRIKESDLNVPTAAQGDTFIVYAEEIGAKAGTLLKVNNPSSPSSICASAARIDNIASEPYKQYIVAYETVTIDSISIFIYGNGGSPGTPINYQVAIYNGALNPNNGAEIPTNTVFASGPIISIPEPANNIDRLVKIPVNITLPGAPGGKGYWIGFPQARKLYKFENSTCVAPKKDDVTGLILVQDGYSSNAGGDIKRNPEIGGAAFNIQFHTKQQYCYRLPVKVVKQCPCNKPTKVNILTTPKPLVKCLGSSLQLTGNFVDAGKPILNGSMAYSWYKKGGTITYKDTAITPTAGATVVIKGAYNDANLIVSDSGVYVLRVQDGKTPTNSSCYTEDSIRVKFEILKKPIIVDTTKPICEGQQTIYKVDPANATSTYAWTITGGTPTTGTTSQVTVTAGTGSTISLQVKETSSIGCESPMGTGTVKIDKKPTVPEISTNGGADITMCGTEQQLAIDPSKYTVGKVKWTNDKGLTFKDATSTQADTLKSTIGDGFTNTTGKAKFVVAVTNGTCPTVKDSIYVTRSGELTAPGLVADNGVIVCVKGSLSFTGNAPKTGAAPAGNDESSRWKWSPTTNVTVDTGSTANNNKAKFTFAQSGTYVLTYIIDNPTCDPKEQSITVTVIDSAKAEILTPVNVVSPATSSTTYRDEPLSISAKQPATNYSGTWATTVGTVANTTALTTSLSGLNYDQTTKLTWSVRDKDNACPAAVATIDITRKDYTKAVVEPDKKVCMDPSTNLAVKAVGGYAVGTETASWSVKRSPNGGSVITPKNGDTTNATFTLSGFGEYEFIYQITNKTLGITTKDSVTVRVDSVTRTPTTTLIGTVANPYKICSSTLSMPGVPNTQTLGKNWWELVSGTGTLPPNVDSSDATPNMTGITGTVVSKYWYQNGVCPAKSVDFVLEKVGDITPTTVKINGGKGTADTKNYTDEVLTSTKLADTLCLGGTYTLDAIDIPVAGVETGTWTVLSGTSVTFSPNPSTNNSLNLTVAGTGETEIQWEIKNDAIPSCNPNTLKIKLVVHDIPVGGTITGNDYLCEGTDTIYKIDPVASSTLPVTYSWGVGPAPQGATLTGTSTGSETTYKFESDVPGSITQGILTANARNRCGANTTATGIQNKTVAIRLAPRNFVPAPNDTINGPKAICASNTGVKYKLDDWQPNTDNDGYVWYWNGQVVSGETDTSAIIMRDWDPLVSSTAKVRVELTNRCTAVKPASIPVPFREQDVAIIKPDALTIALTSNKTNNMFCEPQDAVLVKADLKVENPLLLVTGTYKFFVNGGSTEVYSTTTAPFEYQFPVSTLKDGDKVSVQFIADPDQCLREGIPTDEITMDGYVYPDSVMTVSKPIACDNETITLSIPPSGKNGKGIDWYKDGVLQPQLKNLYSFSLQSPSQSGSYYALVHANVCVHDSKSDTNRVRIYDTPNPVYSPDPLLIFYDKNSPGIPMPLADSGTVDTIRTVFYSGDTYNWLSAVDVIVPIIKTTLDEKTVVYTVKMTTGPADGSYSCEGTSKVTVINTLPLLIPNAFSPNGDGKNEFWIIDGLGQYPGTKVKVYNRWGSSMYTDNSGFYQDHPWDGTHNGVELASGTYYYVIELKGSPTGKEEVRTGSLTIVK